MVDYERERMTRIARRILAAGYPLPLHISARLDELGVELKSLERKPHGAYATEETTDHANRSI